MKRAKKDDCFGVSPTPGSTGILSNRPSARSTLGAIEVAGRADSDGRTEDLGEGEGCRVVRGEDDGRGVAGGRVGDGVDDGDVTQETEVRAPLIVV